MEYAHGFVVLCFVVVMQSFIINSYEVFIHIHQGCFAGTEAIVRLPQCQWSKPGGYGKISQCITTTKHSKAKTVCIFLGIYCIFVCLSGMILAPKPTFIMYNFRSQDFMTAVASWEWSSIAIHHKSVKCQARTLSIEVTRSLWHGNLFGITSSLWENFQLWSIGNAVQQTLFLLVIWNATTLKWLDFNNRYEVHQLITRRS